MTIFDTILITVASAVVLGILARAARIKRQDEAELASRQRSRIGGIREFQEELGRLTKETIRTSQEFKDAKAAYQKKYGRRATDINNASKPKGDGGTDS